MFSCDIRSLGLIVCQVILKTVTVESGFHETPSNTVAVVGQPMKLKCWTNPGETVQWSFSQHVGRTSLLVYNGHAVSPSFTPRFNVDKSTVNGHHDLTAMGVLMADAGIYECVLLSIETPHRSIPVSATAQLIVLESEPNCNVNVSAKYGNIKEFDYVAFRCAVNYSGHWTPSMQWLKDERPLNEAHHVVNSNRSQTMQHLSSVIILQVSAEYNGIRITCKTDFSETSVRVNFTNATNVPNYLFNWTTTLNVHFGAKNVVITPWREKYEQDDVLICTADGNPSPTYSWRNLRTDETIAVGRQLALKKTRIEAGQRYTIECIAQNHVVGDTKLSSTTVAVDVMVSGTWELPYGYIIAAGVSISFTLLTVFILRFFEKQICSGKSRNNANIYKENSQRLSPDYDSIPEAEVNEFPSTSTTPDMAAPTADTSETYTALTERPVIVHQPVVYASLEASSRHVVVLPKRVSESPPVYVNMSIE